MSNLRRHNQFVTTVLNATSTFRARLDCPFIPDEVKVKLISFYNTAVSAGTFSIHVDGLNGMESPIGSFMDPTMSFSGITVPLQSFSPGLFTFHIFQNGALTANPGAGTLNIHLEFRRYARDEMKLLGI